MKQRGLVLLSTLMLVGCSKKDIKDLELSSAVIQVEYGEAIHFEKYLNQGGYESFEVSGYDRMKLGVQTVTISAVYDGEPYESTIEVTVVDTQLPIIEALEASHPVLKVGESFEIDALYHAYDVVDGDLKLIVLTDVDTSKAGSVLVMMEATDANGQTSPASFTLTIEAPQIAVEPPKEEKPAEKPSTNQSGSDSQNNGSSSPSGDGSGSSGNNSSSKPDNSSSKPSTSTKKYDNKEFLFKNGYDRVTGYSACVAYISEAQSAGYQGSCVGIIETLENGNKIGNGYRAELER